MINVPNTVTVARVFVALGVVSMLYCPDDRVRWAAFVLTALVIWADGLDGFLARKLKQTSEFGGMLDIAGDRVVEMAYWIVFANLGWIPTWIPLLFLVRGTFVDSIRAFLSQKGMTAFGEKTMMQTGLGKFLVASNFSRFSYAIAKAVAFCLMIAAHTSYGVTSFIPPIAFFFVYFSVVFCVIRGLPVLVEGSALIRGGSS